MRGWDFDADDDDGTDDDDLNLLYCYHKDFRLLLGNKNHSRPGGLGEDDDCEEGSSYLTKTVYSARIVTRHNQKTRMRD